MDSFVLSSLKKEKDMKDKGLFDFSFTKVYGADGSEEKVGGKVVLRKLEKF